ncbi:MAG TPA: FkbM family methyltransferase [Pyrinomonadaceae bacterium]|jgi:FkbM family methyltransferase
MARLARIPERCARDFRQIVLLKNWREALVAGWRRRPLPRVQLRNRVVIDGPASIDLEFLFQEIWLRHTYDPPGYAIEAGDTVIDVGANIGVFAAYAATRAEGVRVYAYEPFPENARWLRQNVAASGLTNVRVREQAVAGATGPRRLHTDPDSWIMHSLTAAPGDGIEVNCISLADVFAQEELTRCDLLKLDCEGSEYEILEACPPDVLRRVRKIVGEYHQGPAHGGTGRGLCQFLEARGFKIDSFEETGPNCGYFTARNLS